LNERFGKNNKTDTKTLARKPMLCIFALSDCRLNGEAEGEGGGGGGGLI